MADFPQDCLIPNFRFAMKIAYAKCTSANSYLGMQYAQKTDVVGTAMLKSTCLIFQAVAAVRGKRRRASAAGRGHGGSSPTSRGCLSR